MDLLVLDRRRRQRQLVDAISPSCRASRSAADWSTVSLAISNFGPAPGVTDAHRGRGARLPARRRRIPVRLRRRHPGRPDRAAGSSPSTTCACNDRADVIRSAPCLAALVAGGLVQTGCGGGAAAPSIVHEDRRHGRARRHSSSGRRRRERQPGVWFTATDCTQDDRISPPPLRVRPGRLVLRRSAHASGNDARDREHARDSPPDDVAARRHLGGERRLRIRGALRDGGAADSATPGLDR